MKEINSLHENYKFLNHVLHEIKLRITLLRLSLKKLNNDIDEKDFYKVIMRNLVKANLTYKLLEYRYDKF